MFILFIVLSFFCIASFCDRCNTNTKNRLFSSYLATKKNIKISLCFFTLFVFFPLKGMASKSSKTLFSLLIFHLFALPQCKSPFKISRMSHVTRSTKFRGDIHKGKCRCKLVCFFFFSYQTFYNGHVCLIPKIPNLITCLCNSTFFTLMASSYANL